MNGRDVEGSGPGLICGSILAFPRNDRQELLKCKERRVSRTSFVLRTFQIRKGGRGPRCSVAQIIIVSCTLVALR